jgi:3-oxoacid CoA-transferase subunit A
MIKHVLITGDTHGRVEGRLAYIKETMPEYNPRETAVIILGDVGFQYYKNKKDWKLKHHAAQFGYTLYCLRGNHEDRACNMEKPIYVIDDFVNGIVCYEEEFPSIRYFMDSVAEYEIMGKKVLCIPGAYSVDKWYRLENDWQWFAEEQLSEEEMKTAEIYFSDKYYDFVFSHTCPISWEPTDLFLPGLDQSSVDKTMELWLDEVKQKVDWNIWLFGHYHGDQLIRPGVEMYYKDIENWETIMKRWESPDQLDWWLVKSPNYYMGN